MVQTSCFRRALALCCWLVSYEALGEVLGHVISARSRARAARHGFGFPLLALGLVTAGALPLYVLYQPAAPASTNRVEATPLMGAVGGYSLPHGGQWAALYWLVALPLVCAATVAWYHARGHRLGIEARTWPAAAVGLVLLAVFFASAPGIASLLRLPGWVTAVHPGGDLAGHGLSPLLVVVLMLGVLAYLERSGARLAYTVVFAGVALLVNLYDLENLLWRLFGTSVPAPLTEFPNVCFAAAFLLVGGAWFSLCERRA